MREITESRPTLTILVGLPRAGKTSYARQYKGQAIILSADRLRYLVYNQRFWSGGEDLMWSIHDIVLKLLLEQQVDIISDETNYTIQSRERIIKLAREYGYKITCVVIPTPLQVCIQRAKEENYSRIIPFIEHLSREYQPPAPEEGIDKIITYDMAKS